MLLLLSRQTSVNASTLFTLGILRYLLVKTRQRENFLCTSTLGNYQYVGRRSEHFYVHPDLPLPPAACSPSTRWCSIAKKPETNCHPVTPLLGRQKREHLQQGKEKHPSSRTRPRQRSHRVEWCFVLKNTDLHRTATDSSCGTPKCSRWLEKIVPCNISNILDKQSPKAREKHSPIKRTKRQNVDETCPRQILWRHCRRTLSADTTDVYSRSCQNARCKNDDVNEKAEVYNMAHTQTHPQP